MRLCFDRRVVRPGTVKSNRHTRAGLNSKRHFTVACALIFLGAISNSNSFPLLSDMFTDKEPAIIAGKILDSETGKPIVAAVVTVMKSGKMAFAQTDGSFLIDSINPGRQRLFFEASGYVPVVKKLKLGERDRDTLEILLNQIKGEGFEIPSGAAAPAIICGQIFDAHTNGPISKASLNVERGDISTKSDPDGAYHIIVPDKDSAVLKINHMQYQDTSIQLFGLSGGGVKYVNVALARSDSFISTLGVILGRVTTHDAAHGVEKALVTTLNAPCSSYTNADGRFFMRDVPLGSYTVVVKKPGFRAYVSEPLRVAASDSVEVHFALKKDTPDYQSKTGKISGFVYTSDSTAIPEMEIHIRRHYLTDTTKENGQYEFDALLPDFYTLELWPNASDAPITRDVYVEEGTHSRIDFYVSDQKDALDSSKPSQAGVSGLTVDSISGDPIPGVRIAIEKLGLFTISNAQGRFHFNKVPAGVYCMSVTHNEYEHRYCDSLQVRSSSEQIVKDFVLTRADATEMDAMTVRAAAVKNTNAAMLQVRKESITISDGIASDEMSKSGASNAADALKLVTGVTIVEDKYVIVRGLSGRYSTVTLNGIVLPYADPDRHAVSLDIFPTSLLDNCKISKTWTPDMPVDFAGGTVDLVTSTFPEELELSLNASAGYKENVTGRTIIGDQPGSLDWLGFDDGTRSVPALLSARRVDLPNIESGQQFIAESLDAGGNTVYYLDSYSDKEWIAMHQRLSDMSRSFETDFSPERTTAAPNLKGSIAAGNTFSLHDRPLGVFATFNYSKKHSRYTDGIKVKRYMWENKEKGTFILDSNTAFIETKGSQQVAWSALVNSGYNFSDNHKISSIYIYTRIAENIARDMYSTYHKQISSGNEKFFKTEIEYPQRGLHFGILNGSHNFTGAPRFGFKWKLAYTRAFQHEPDHRITTFVRKIRPYENGGQMRNDTSYSIPLSFGTGVNPEHRYRYITDNDFTAQIDFSTHAPVFNWIQGKTTDFRYGARFRHITRDFFQNGFEIKKKGKSIDDCNGDIDEYTSDGNVGLIEYDPESGDFTMGNYVRPQGDTAVNHNAWQRRWAGYGMAVLPLLDFFTMVGGLRYQTTDMEVNSWKKGDSLYEGELHLDGLYFGIQGIGFLPHDIQLRIAYSKTAVLPIFREKAPYSSYDLAMEQTIKGNPILKASTIHNYDVRFEWYMNPEEIIALSVFYKRVHDLIVKGYGQIDNDLITYRNIDEMAWALGMELEIKKRMLFLPGWLRGFALGGNLTLLKSKWHVDEEKEEQLLALSNNPEFYRSLPGASPLVVNASIIYDHPSDAFSAAVFFNIFSKRIDFVTADNLPDAYEYSRPWLGLSISKKFGGRLKIKAKADNLLDAAYMVGHEFEGKDYIREYNKKGRSYSLGVGYSF